MELEGVKLRVPQLRKRRELEAKSAEEVHSHCEVVSYPTPIHYELNDEGDGVW